MIECEFCGSVEQIEEHHIYPRRFFGEQYQDWWDEPTVTVCRNCHDKLEQIYDDAFFERVAMAIENDRIVGEKTQLHLKECLHETPIRADRSI